MKTITKLTAVVLAVLCLLTACSKPKEWTIQGSFDVSDTIQYGDTFFLRPPLDGINVYLLDMNGDIIDTAKVENEMFTMTGIAEEPQMRYLACEYCIGTVVVEAGTINVIMSDNFEATGTPNNDGISRLEGRLAELQEEGRTQILSQGMQDTPVSAQSDSVQQLMYAIYFDLMSKIAATIDSTAEAHPEDMIGVYAWSIKIGSVENAALLDTMLIQASDYVRNSELMQARRAYLENQEKDQDFDPEEFGLDPGEEGTEAAMDEDGMPGPPPGDDEGKPGPPPGDEGDMPGRYHFDEDGRPLPIR